MPAMRVGIIGCGRMGRERARCASSSGAEVCVVFDTDAARASELGVEYGAIALAEVDEMAELDLDAVFLCIPPGLRSEAERLCLQMALPFYVEKPLGISGAACKPMLESLIACPVLHGVGYMNRYRRSVGLARESLRGTTIVGFAGHWVGRRYNVPWWEVERCSGGAHNEQATHLFDLVRYVIGEVRTVKSVAARNSRVATCFECEGGIAGTAFYSCDGSGKDIGLRVFTDKGTVALTGWNFALTENGVDGQVESGEGEDIFLVETANFLAAVDRREQRIMRSDAFDAARTQAVMDAAHRSAGDSDKGVEAVTVEQDGIA